LYIVTFNSTIYVMRTNTRYRSQLTLNMIHAIVDLKMAQMNGLKHVS